MMQRGISRLLGEEGDAMGRDGMGLVGWVQMMCKDGDGFAAKLFVNK